MMGIMILYAGDNNLTSELKMSREITEHQQNAANKELTVRAEDGPGPGGASHVYSVRNGLENILDASAIRFQNGALKEVGVNGITHEALIAIILDRMRSFQEGPYACRENALAITKLEEALMWLHKRTQGREARGVEGTMEV